MGTLTLSAGELPEIGPYVGRLADATRQSDAPSVGLDSIRLDLVTDLFERAAVARDFLLAGDASGARVALDRTTWLTLWRTAVGRVVEAVISTARSDLERAAYQSRYPTRRLVPLLPTTEDRAVLEARLDAAGIVLEERVARGFGTGEVWRDQIRQAAVALEDAWEALEVEVRQERAGWRRRAEEVARWRPPLWPWVGALTAVTIGVVWFGLMLGGYLPRPAWLDPVHRWFWSLPWR